MDHLEVQRRSALEVQHRAGVTIHVKGVEVPRVAVDLFSAAADRLQRSARRAGDGPQLSERLDALRHAFHNLKQAARPILVEGVEVPRVAVDLLSAAADRLQPSERLDDLRHAFQNLKQAACAHPIQSAPPPRYRLARYACEILSLRAIWNAVELQTHLSWWRATAAGRRLHARQLQRRQATALVALAVASLVRQNLVRAAQSARARHERRALAAWLATVARSRCLEQAVAAVRGRQRRRAIAAGLAAVGAEAASALMAVRCAAVRHALRALQGHASRRHEWRGVLTRSAALWFHIEKKH